VAVFVSGRVVGDLSLSVGSPRNDGHSASPAQHPPQRSGVIALVGQHVACAPGVGQKLRRDCDVRDIPGREDQRERAAYNVCEGMDLGRLAAPRRTDPLRPAPPFPPKAERCALM
jgi:hypothetical protein